MELFVRSNRPFPFSGPAGAWRRVAVSYFLLAVVVARLMGGFPLGLGPSNPLTFASCNEASEVTHSCNLWQTSQFLSHLF